MTKRSKISSAPTSSLKPAKRVVTQDASVIYVQWFALWSLAYSLILSPLIPHPHVRAGSLHGWCDAMTTSAVFTKAN